MTPKNRLGRYFMPSFPRKQLMLGLALAGFADLGQAAGFALVELNASGLDNAYAGQAASPQEASTIIFTPAGMLLRIRESSLRIGPRWITWCKERWHLMFLCPYC